MGTLIGIADQAVWSLGNVVFVAMVSQRVGDAAFGAFTIAMGLVLLATGAAGALTHEALLVADREHRDGDEQLALGFGITVAAVFGGGLALASLLADDPLAPVLLAFGAGLPLLAWVEVHRGLCGLRGSVGWLLASDLAWTGGAIAGLLQFGGDGVGAARLALVWVGSAGLALGVHLLHRRSLPQFRLSAWRSRHGRTGASFLSEFAVSSGVAQLVPVIVGSLAGLDAAGVLRLSQVAFGPFTSLTTGIRMVYAPQLRRRHERGVDIRRAGARVGLLLAVLAVVWGAVAWAVPVDAGAWAFGDRWVEARRLVPYAAWQRAVVGLSLGAIIVVRCLGLVDESRRRRLAIGVSTAVGAAVGAALGGAMGAALALALVQTLAVAAWWSLLRAEGHAAANS